MEEQKDLQLSKNIYCLSLHNMKVEGIKKNISNIQKTLNCCEINIIDDLSRVNFFKIEE